LLKRYTLALMITAGLFGADFDWKLPQDFPSCSVRQSDERRQGGIGPVFVLRQAHVVNGKESCGTCHRQELAFTDGRARAERPTGQAHPRGSMSLVNVAYAVQHD